MLLLPIEAEVVYRTDDDPGLLLFGWLCRLLLLRHRSGSLPVIRCCTLSTSAAVASISTPLKWFYFSLLSTAHRKPATGFWRKTTSTHATHCQTPSVCATQDDRGATTERSKLLTEKPASTTATKVNARSLWSFLRVTNNCLTPIKKNTHHTLKLCRSLRLLLLLRTAAVSCSVAHSHTTHSHSGCCCCSSASFLLPTCSDESENATNATAGQHARSMPGPTGPR